MRSKSPDEGTGITDLPAGFTWKSRYLHTMRSASGSRSSTLSVGKSITIASATSKLNSEAFAHEVRPMEGCEVMLLCIRALGIYCSHTRNDIASIHSILVLDKAEAIHELDLGDLSRAMSVEVGFDISLSS